MRKITERALRDFDNATASPASLRGGSVWTDGTCLFSYGTVIAQPEGNFRMLFNVTSYSRTTSRVQNEVREHLSRSVRLVEVDDVPRGARALFVEAAA